MKLVPLSHVTAKLTLALLAAAILLPVSAFAQHEMHGFVMASGGGTVVASTHSLSYTIGQPVVSTAIGTIHVIQSGFWGASPHVTATDPVPSVPLPLVDALYPGVPNPFNPFTTIQYDVPDPPARVRLRIFDLRGKLIETLVDEIQMPGRRQATWNGRDANGAPVASGTYLCVLEAHSTRRAQKLVLVK